MIKSSFARKIFSLINGLSLTLFCLLIIIPFANVIAISLSDYDAIVSNKVGLIPIGFSLKGYALIVTNLYFVRALINSSFLTVLNSFLVIVIAICAAYALSEKCFPGRKIALTYLLIPMYFNGGLIPSYILINNWLSLNNNYLALILPSIINVFMIIIFRNAIIQLPRELFESAEIDGAGSFLIVSKIVIPLISPMIAAFTVFSAVSYWNEWFGCLLYIRDINKYTLQYRLRDIIMNYALTDDPSNPLRISTIQIVSVHPQSLKMAALIVTIIPIFLVYPFVQKYFIHGIIVGAVKG